MKVRLLILSLPIHLIAFSGFATACPPICYSWGIVYVVPPMYIPVAPSVPSVTRTIETTPTRGAPTQPPQNSNSKLPAPAASNHKPTAPLSGIPSEPETPAEPRAAVPDPPRIPPVDVPTSPSVSESNSKTEKQKEENPAAKGPATPDSGVVVPPSLIPKNSGTGDPTFPPLRIPTGPIPEKKSQESKSSPLGTPRPLVSVLPVAGPVPANPNQTRTVTFYNYTDLTIRLTVEGEPILLPSRHRISANVPNEFEWSTGNNLKTRTSVPLASPGLDIVLRR